MRAIFKSVVVVAGLALLLLAAVPRAYANACQSARWGNWASASTWSNCGGVIPQSTDTVEISGNDTITINVSNAVAASLTIGRSSNSGSGTLVFSSGSQLTVSGSVTLGSTVNSGDNGTITMTAGGTLIVGSLALGISGKTWTPGSGTVVMTATNTLPATTFTTFNNLTINGGTTTLGRNVTISSNLTVTAGTLDLGSFTANRGSAGGTLTAANNATLKIGGTNSFPTNYSTNTLAVASTVEYYGTNQTVANQLYGNLKLSSSSGAAVKTFPATALTVAGNLTTVVGAGTSVSFTAAANIAVNGSASLGASTTFNGGSYSHTIGGNWTNSGTFTGSTSTVTFTGTGASVGGSGSHNFNNLTVTGSGVSFSNNSFSVAGNLATTGAGSFTQASGGTFVMTGTSKAISGTGISIDNLTVSGSVTTASSFTLTGNLSVSGSFVASTGTITMGGASKTISGAGTKSFNQLLITGSISTAADFSISSGVTVNGSLSASAGTATFTGVSTLSGVANLYNVTLNGTSLQLAGSSTLGIANALTITAGTLNVTSSIPNTVSFNGSGAQSVNALTYDNLVLSGGNNKTAAAGVTINRDLTIGAGTTFISGAYTHSIYRDWNNLGSFTPGSGTVEFLGSASSAINGATTFNLLTLNKATSAATLTLQNDVSASTVNMTSGKIQTGSNTITMTTTRTGNGEIYGHIQRTHSFTTGVAYAFEGPNNTITFSSVSGVSTITVTVDEVTVPDFPYGSAVNEEYSIDIPSGTYDATLRLDYDDDGLNGNNEATMTLWRYNGSAWVDSGKTANDTTANYIELSGLTSIITRWTFANPGGASVVEWNGSVSSDWNTAANWTALQGSPSRPPSANDTVYLGTAAFTNNPTISNAATAKQIHFGSAQAVTLTMASGGSLTSNNIDGEWSSSVTHTLNVNNQSMTVNGDLELSDGTSGHAINLNIGSGTVTVEGNLTQSGGANIVFSGTGTLNLDHDFTYVSGTFTAGSGTVSYVGGSNQTVGEVSYNNLTINKASTATINNPITIGGNLSIVAGVLDNRSTTTIMGTVEISPGASLYNYLHLHVKGDWTNNGTFSPAASASMFFDGSGTQYISASTFNNLNINKTVGSSAILTGDVVINNNLIITSGTLDIGSFACNRSVPGGTITIGDDATFIVGANNAPTNFTGGSVSNSSTVIASGTGPQAIYGETFGNLVFRNAGLKTLITPITVNGDLTIENGATFDAGSQTLTLNGNWINNGTFTPSSSTIVWAGADKSISGANAFNQVLVTGSYTVLNDTTYDGLLNVTSTGSVSAGADVHSTLNGDLTSSGVLYVLGPVTYSGNALQTLRLIDAVSTVSVTVNFNGSVSPVLQSTSSPQFGYLNINNTGGVNPSVGWTVLYAMNIGTGASFNGGDSSHNFAGPVTNNGTITSSGALNFVPSSSATVSLGSDFSSTGLVNFGGTGALTLSGTPSSLHDVTISNTNTAGITPASDWTLTNNLTVNNGSILNAGNRTFSVGGNISNSGTINSGTSTFVLNGAGTQDIYSASAFKNLTVNKSADVVTLSSDVTVNGVLNFIAGQIQTGVNRLIQPSSGTLTGAGQSTGWVNGNLQKNIPTGSNSRTFEVGGPNNYSPITTAFSGVSTAGDLTASGLSGDHASIGSSTIDPAKSINRTWTLTNNGIVFATYDATFNFVASDVDAGVNTSAVKIGTYGSGSWTYPTVGTKTSTSTQATGLTAFGEFQIGATTSIPTVALTLSVSPNGSVAPRTDLVYTINFVNNGAGPASAFVITDPIPANTDFKVGSVTTNLGSTGLTPTISYSNDGGTTWTYTPSSGGGGAPAGYDRNVTNVRWSFASTLSQTSPNNVGSVTLTARIR